jgi:hypothetical protein
MKDIVIYHTLCGNFDAFKEPLQYCSDYDYIMYTDQPLLTDGYVLREFDNVFPDPALTAKEPKILPHKYLSNYKLSIYIDANFHITGDIRELIDKYKHNLFTVFRHPHPTQGENRTIDQELEECCRAKLDRKDLLKAQVSYYKSAGYKKEYPFNACGFMMRQHNDHRVIAFMDEWWFEILKWSKRDQISFPYVQWKHRLPLTYVDFCMYKSPYWRKFDHNWKLKK